MSIVVELNVDGASVRGEAPARPAPPPPLVANDGHGDVRKKIVPVIKPSAGPSVARWESGTYVSLREWLDSPRSGAAVLLLPADDVRLLKDRLTGVALISVDFPRIGDGRGYSQAALLRRRLDYKGPLRAVGAVTADQIDALARVGFDAFELRADQDVDTALAALNTFSLPYQERQDAPGALFDRRSANEQARVLRLERALRGVAELHRPALASSLSLEDMVITDAIARLRLPIDVFTLNTGRLHVETVALISETERRYGINIKQYHPDLVAVDRYAQDHGVDGFYDGVEQRKLCCGIRKVEPLSRALKDRGAWITGQRREQTATRASLMEVEHDAERDAAKFNPLADWGWADVLSYAERFDIPKSTLYARGYVSIGCEPCTKAIRPGEDPRAGRWWWEDKDAKECGLHVQLSTP
jgi:phosphoadenosine phosphosulfate reductase